MPTVAGWFTKPVAHRTYTSSTPNGLGVLLKDVDVGGAADDDGKIDDGFVKTMVCPSQDNSQCAATTKYWGTSSSITTPVIDYLYFVSTENLDSGDNIVTGKKRQYVLDYTINLGVNQLENHEDFVNVLFPDSHAKGFKNEDDKLTLNTSPVANKSPAKIGTKLDSE